DEKAHAPAHIEANVVAPDAGLEQCLGYAELEPGSRLDVHGHDLAVLTAVVEPVPVAAPHRGLAGGGRDLPFLGWLREADDVDFVALRLVRLVGEPSTIRR